MNAGSILDHGVADDLDILYKIHNIFFIFSPPCGYVKRSKRLHPAIALATANKETNQ
jgi:hypothetical protein